MHNLGGGLRTEEPRNLHASVAKGHAHRAYDRGKLPAVISRVRHELGTLLGRPRREHILRLAPRAAVCAEIGVFRGEFTRHIVRITKPRQLHLIDGWWTLYGDRFPDWGPYTDHGRLPTRQAHDEARRAAPDATVHVGDDIEILAGFPDHQFDWVYLDSSHEYEHTTAELAILARKLKPRGLILGDDWHEDPSHLHAGVTKAVRETCAASEWRLIVPGDLYGQWAIQLQNAAAG